MPMNEMTDPSRNNRGRTTFIYLTRALMGDPFLTLFQVNRFAHRQAMQDSGVKDANYFECRTRGVKRPCETSPHRAKCCLFIPFMRSHRNVKGHIVSESEGRSGRA